MEHQIFTPLYSDVDKTISTFAAKTSSNPNNGLGQPLQHLFYI